MAGQSTKIKSPKIIVIWFVYGLPYAGQAERGREGDIKDESNLLCMPANGRQKKK